MENHLMRGRASFIKTSKYIWNSQGGVSNCSTFQDLVWNNWNRKNITKLKQSQNEDGSWGGQFGTTFSTSASLLSIALNYRFLPIYER